MTFNQMFTQKVFKTLISFSNQVSLYIDLFYFIWFIFISCAAASTSTQSLLHRLITRFLLSHCVVATTHICF